MITINETLCSNCSACVDVCPIGLICPADTFPIMPVENEKRCLFCGHCESVCPEGALKHSYPEITSESMHSGKSSILPEDLGLYMRNRRSIRNFLEKPVDKKILIEIMDIVRYAPSGMNRQSVNWTIIHNTEKVKQLTELTIEWMKKMVQTENSLKAVIPFNMLIEDYNNGRDSLCRNAPHLFITHTLKNYSIGSIDAVIAITHLDILLPAFGIGGCWAGYFNLALRFCPELFIAAGLPDDQVTHGVLLAGYPKYEYHKIPKRNKPVINWQ